MHQSQHLTREGYIELYKLTYRDPWSLSKRVLTDMALLDTVRATGGLILR